MIKPRKLNPGDTIAIISPSSPTKDSTAVPRGKAFLESLGYNVILGKHVDEWRGNYIAASEEARAEDLNEMFARKDVDMILCARGGYGALQFVNRIDFENIKANPKLFCGYSDITSLHLAIHKFAGLVTIHGEVLTALNGSITPYTKDHWLRCLTTTEPRREITLADPGKFLTAIAPGKAEGEVLGGNLSLLAGSCGTFYQPDLRGKILFFEELNEEPYALDRYLAQLRNCGMLDGLKGVMIGECENCVDHSGYYPDLMDTFRYYFADLGVPCLYGLPMGHTKDQAALPLGVNVRLDADAKTFEILESAVTD
ncbi:MAG: LD-carboxypeptidase [Firmicutes bacterium]|nr:LD-carboxypeptidase [Bacillota bacterium]MBR3035365.1 LD-carboxypeptidase [Bacillota bacterium]MBR6969373.1 LD-carboxypeptidase [Bacillota bacterium]